MDNDKEIDIKELIIKIASLSPTEKPHAIALLSTLGIDLTLVNSNLTGTEVSGFIFEKEFHHADSHKAVFIAILEIMLRKYPHKAELLFEIKGTTKVYFSNNPADFRHSYEQLRGSGIYADTNENAKQLNLRCQKVLQKFGVDPRDLIIL